MSLLNILRMSANKTLRYLGVSIVQLRGLPGERRSKIISHHGIQTVVDVGANNGSYGSELRASGYSGRIISFEPTAQAYRSLATRAKKDRLWETQQTALGASPGEATINVAENGAASSSLLKMRDFHKQCSPHSGFVSSENVNITTLDIALGGLLRSQDKVLLKIDVQGYEHMVLKGACEIIPHVDLIECELSFVKLYDGQLLFEEMLYLLKELGFSPVQFVPGFTDPRTGHALQVDGIFARCVPANGVAT